MASFFVRLLDRIPGGIAAHIRSEGPVAKALRPVTNRLLPAGPTIVTVRSGIGRGLRLVLKPREEKFYWTGTHDVAVGQAMASLLHPGDSFWDVGAHIGYFSLVASRLVGASGAVHAFEPAAPTGERFRANLTLNAITNVTLHSVAIAVSDGEVSFQQLGGSGLWRITEGKGTTRVRSTTLDRMLQQLRPPDLIKVDVEGAEMAVFCGSAQLLRLQRPWIVEIWSPESLRALQRLCPGYSFERLDDRNFLMH